MFTFIKDMWQDGIEGKFILLLCLSLIILIPFSFYLTNKEQKEWEIFYVQHNCKKISHTEGETIVSTTMVVQPNGSLGTLITASKTPDKIGYLCDDGVTYWR